MAEWTWIPPAVSGTQVEGTGLLPLGRYRMPDGTQQVSFGLPQGGLDLWRSLRQGLGYEQDPNAPQGYVSEKSILKGALGGAGGAITGSLGAGAARALAQGRPRGLLSSGGAPDAPPGTIRAYHGSPHDFDRFDMTKIGTGEGAQAYGHGLYFAESPAVAKSYKTDLAGRTYSFNGKEIAGGFRDEMGRALDTVIPPNSRWANPGQRDSLIGLYTDAINYANTHGIAPREALDEVMTMAAKRQQRNFGETPSEAKLRAKMDAERAEIFEKLNPSVVENGRLYTVNIKAKPEDFLDWDKPLSAQPGVVGEKVRSAFSKGFGEENADLFINGSGSLREKMWWLERDTGRPAEEYFREAGIPGIRYLDQGSRADGKGTYNYVLFDDSLVEIAHKYGFVIPGPGINNGEDTEQPMTAIRGKDMRKLMQIARREQQ